ncbi:MAG: PAS domain-containing protein [Deltaproteobacteria bacterium]|nr:PAS domain-containing protein [Deltaproteobacteria bacterium]
MRDLSRKDDVLVISDDSQFLKSFLEKFQDPLFSFSYFSSKEEAQDFLKVRKPLIILGGENFVSFLEEAKKVSPYSVRVFLSEENNLETIQEAINQADVYRVISSDSDLIHLRKTLREVREYGMIYSENQKLLQKAEEQSLELDQMILSLEKNIEERTKILAESRLEISQTEAELEHLNKFLKNISMAMTIEDIKVWLEKELKNILPIDELSLVVNEPQPRGFKNADKFTVAFPLIYGTKLLGHFYLRGKDEELLKQAELLLGFLQQVTHTIAITVDRIQSFEAIAQDKKAWEASFDAIVDPVAILNHHYEVIRANSAYARASGTSLQKLFGRKCYEVFENRKTFCEGCYVKEAFSANQGVMSDISSLKQNKKYKATSYPVLDKNGKVKFIVQYYKDVTREHSYRDQLVRAEKTAELGILAGSIAHEINNPLGGILAFVQILKSELQEKEPLFEDILDIEEAALRCKRIIENLLKFARQSRDEKRKKYYLQNILKLSIALIEFQAKHFNISITKKISSKPIYILGHFNQLWQAIVNILENAIEAVVEKKEGAKKIKITVQTFSKKTEKGIEKCVRIALINNGKPISKSELSKIFDPLYTTKDPQKNPGLGLSMSQSIVQDHGGQLRVYQTPKKETVFAITLPVFE